MLTLSYGFKKPQSGDNGTVFFPSLELDIQQLNDHTHDGSNSSALPTSSLIATTQSIASGSWISTGGGTYRQSVTIPGGLQYDNVAISLRDSASGNPLMLTVEKIDSTHYWVYINDNSLSLTAFYGI